MKCEIEGASQMLNFVRLRFKDIDASSKFYDMIDSGELIIIQRVVDEEKEET